MMVLSDIMIKPILRCGINIPTRHMHVAFLNHRSLTDDCLISCGLESRDIFPGFLAVLFLDRFSHGRITTQEGHLLLSRTSSD